MGGLPVTVESPSERLCGRWCLISWSAPRQQEHEQSDQIFGERILLEQIRGQQPDFISSFSANQNFHIQTLNICTGIGKDSLLFLSGRLNTNLE